MTKSRLLIIVNTPRFFLSHRLPIALAAKNAGYDVYIATAGERAMESIREHGLQHHTLPLNRSGNNPLAELNSIWRTCRLFRKLRPDVVHLVTIKPVLYGGIAARLAGVKSVVAAISGLGVVFSDETAGGHLAKRIVPALYRLALKYTNVRGIFQNTDDRDILVRLGAISENRTRLIRGSGVPLQEYPMLSEPAEHPYVVSFAARLLWSKGLEEFVTAARLLAERNMSVRFRLIGSPDLGNPTSCTAEDLDQWRERPELEILGFREDIASLFSSSHLVVLPSYREGLPKALVEAAACGRAVVTTDVPGCRDAIEPNETGLLVPPRDAHALADAIELLLRDTSCRKAMGRAGRALAEREFAIEKIVQQHLDIYRELEGRSA